MNTAVMGSKKIRRNVHRRTELKKPVATGAVVGGIAQGVGRTMLTLVQWAAGMVIIVCVSYGILSGYRWVTRHEFFSLKSLGISGGQRLSKEEIAALGGVQVGANVLGINIAEVQRRIAANEWVESVAVTRVLPDGLTIEIREREPAFLVRRDEHLFYADRKGQPIVSVGLEKFISLPLLEKEEGVAVCAGIGQLLEEISRNTLPFGMSQLAWLRQDSAEQYSLYLEKPRILVQLDGTDLQATLACLARLWADLENRGELDRAGFMFVMPGRAWIRLTPEHAL